MIFVNLEQTTLSSMNKLAEIASTQKPSGTNGKRT